MPNELEEFLKDVQEDGKPADLLNEPLTGAPAGAPEKDAEEPKNRAERRNAARRWERELQDKEKEIIAREARLQAIAEIQSKSVPTEVPNEWLQMFGDKPETRQAWALQEKLDEAKFNRLKEELRNDVLKDQEQAREAERQAESELEDIFDQIEETHNIDLSSNSAAAKKARSQYLDALAAISHKNENGEVDVYGDPMTAYELYELKRSKETSPTIQRQKDLAARGMGSTGEANVQKGNDDAVKAYLRSEGINV